MNDYQNFKISKLLGGNHEKKDPYQVAPYAMDPTIREDIPPWALGGIRLLQTQPFQATKMATILRVLLHK